MDFSVFVNNTVSQFNGLGDLGFRLVLVKLKSQLQGAQSVGMLTMAQGIAVSASLMMSSTAAIALEMTCIHPDRPNHSYKVSGGQGVYTWDDHEIARSWPLECNEHNEGSTTCHRSENFGERGSSVMIFRMLPDGSLFESGYWALLDTSRVSITPGFVCNTQGE
jgi:hypothetical protein